MRRSFVALVAVLVVSTLALVACGNGPHPVVTADVASSGGACEVTAWHAPENAQPAYESRFEIVDDAGCEVVVGCNVFANPVTEQSDERCYTVGPGGDTAMAEIPFIAGGTGVTIDTVLTITTVDDVTVECFYHGTQKAETFTNPAGCWTLVDI